MRRVRQFPRDPASVKAAREFIAEVLRGGPGADIDAIQLMVSELATNCIRHTDTGFDVAIVHDHTGAIRVEVADGSAREPVMRAPGPEEPTGRGLRIVDMLASAWGVEQRAGRGKTVWFTVGERLAA